jgi:FkbM family methyltransferase
VEFYSQVGQDRQLYERFFKDRRGGVFVDVGAYDGVTFSNSLFFERFMGWTGLCVEPLPAAFAQLRAARACHCEQVCVSNFEGAADFTLCDTDEGGQMLSGLAANIDPRHADLMRIVGTRTETVRVPVTRLASLLDKYGLTDIDYCSIDTEGSELAILADLDFDKYRIRLLTVENNYDDPRMVELMNARGFDGLAKLRQDYVFKRRGA